MSLSSIWACGGGNQETIVALTPTGGGVTKIGGTWYTSVRAAHDVTITAVTNPAGAGTWANLVWTGVAAHAGQTATVPRTPVGAVAVTASLDNTKSLALQFVELQTLVCEGGVPNGPNTWKVWRAAGAFADVTATPNPDVSSYRNKLTWTWVGGVAGRSARRRRVARDAVGNVPVTATLYEDSKQITVRVCELPVLRLDELTFGNGHVVNCDDHGDFDDIWARTRADPDPSAVGGVDNPAGTDNSVLCYTRGTRVHITATLAITTPPTDNEQVIIRGRATIGGVDLRWEDLAVAVPSAGGNATTAAMISDVDLPNTVGRYENVRVTWEMVGPDGRTTALGRTSHLIYATLAAPPAPVYWTLLEISCRAAHGANTGAQLVSRSFAAFRNTRGDGRGFKRSRDGQRLAYYLLGSNTPGVNVFQTRDLLANADGSARCGAWARFFVSLCGLHGVAANVFGVTPRLGNGHLLLVKNCAFGGAGNAATAPWTHAGNAASGAGRCSKKTGAAGQGKTNPQFVFGDHALVNLGGQIYDPSYGTGPFPDHATWEAASIDGLGRTASGVFNFFQSDGTRQFLTNDCSPGFIQHPVAVGQTVATVAALYGMTANQLWNHPYNRAIRALRVGGVGTVAIGDILVIPRRGSNISILQ